MFAYHTMAQGVERFAMGLAGTDEARIRRDTERLLFQPVEFQEHTDATFEGRETTGRQTNFRCRVRTEPTRPGLIDPTCQKLEKCNS